MALLSLGARAPTLLPHHKRFRSKGPRLLILSSKAFPPSFSLEERKKREIQKSTKIEGLVPLRSPERTPLSRPLRIPFYTYLFLVLFLAFLHSSTDIPSSSLARFASSRSPLPPLPFYRACYSLTCFCAHFSL